MNRIRVVAVDTRPKGFMDPLLDVEEAVNQKIIELEQDGHRVLNLIPVKDKGFLILYEEPYQV